jgi:hypothetical protein
MDSKLWQEENAPDPIVRTPFSIVIDVKPSQY